MPSHRALAPSHRLSWLALAVLASSSAASAAESSTPVPQAGATALKTVTVTATRREASLQKVPVAVSVVDGEQLERDNRNNIAGLVQQVPSLNYRATASSKDSSLFVRGVGTISTSPGVEPSVATVVDGVVYGRPGQSTLDLMDVERIEVLRGPQGTLFGRNASAGVLNVISREAPDETQGFVDYGFYGKGNENRLRFGIGGRLSETLKGSLSTLWGRYDGNVRNVHDGRTVNGYDRQGVRGKLYFTPNETLRLTLIGDYLEGEDSTPNGVPSWASSAFAGSFAPAVAGARNRQVQNDYKTYAEDTHKGLSAQVDWRLGQHTLTSISAWRGWDNTQHQDQDALAALPVRAIHDYGQVDFDQFSQELRLASPSGRFLEYVTGLYLFHGNSDEAYQRRSLAPGYGDTLGHGEFSASNDSYALFGEGTLNLRDDWRLIVGLRATHDEVEYDHWRISTSATSVPSIRPSYASSGSHSDNGISGRLGLQHDFSEHLTGYATYSRGYKGPAYNVYFQMYEADIEPLDPETSNSYEIGLKYAGPGQRLTANLALFRSDYDDYQANFYDQIAGSPVTRLINAGSVRTQGVELDSAWQATRQLRFSGSVAYTHARIDRFQCPPAAAASCNIDGEPLPFTPDWKTYVRADYGIPLGNGLDLELSSDYNWQSEVQFSLDQNPDTVQGAYGIWNASVALADYNQGWRVALLAKNLADKSYTPYIIDSTSNVRRWVPRDDERYVGIQARKDF
ncbi:iron complex outermembrane recepter protein [Pseudomonas flavescens]|uniref:Iron complex outermembrane recepter protein n=1 Tax=Phytopseudomonas flavescens TaxID=29435 RepID=A0A1G8G0R3_9GAMM|nr:TonB-dependent receptor [Pseudomonas flavescens]SDH87935.1 iron complex outermembrane recepter protein [Pseudomonas flavescens]